MSLYRKETNNRRRGNDDRVHVSEGVKAKIARSRERLLRDYPEKENQKTITFGEVVEIPKAKNGKNPVIQKLQMLTRSLSAKFNKDDESGLQKKFNSLMFKDKEEKKKKQ